MVRRLLIEKRFPYSPPETDSQAEDWNHSYLCSSSNGFHSNVIQ